MKYNNLESVCVTHQDTRLTWVELLDAADRFASALLKEGFSPGDRFGIWMPNYFEWTVSQLACARVGVVLVNLNPAYREHEVEHALNLVGCKGILITPQYLTSDYIGLLDALCPELKHCTPGRLRSARVPSLTHVVSIAEESLPGMMRFSDMLGSKDEAEIARVGASLSQHDPINIQFTSGTTGLPKAATLTHHNILNNGFFVGERMNLTVEDRLCVPVPLYHCFGTVLGNLAAFTHGSSLVFPAPAFNAELTLQAAEAERCTALYGVPSMFIAELALPNFADFDLSHLRTGIMAGSPCPAEVMRRVMEEMHMSEVTIAYGMTETSPVSFQSGVSDSAQLRCDTVGTIMPHTEVKVVDTEGETVPVGQPGELLTKGYLVMRGYWGQEEATAEVMTEDGYLHTGDLATIDERGYCRIVGRIKDMVIRGGENLYPREIEEFLHGHPDVVDVSVVGVPDERYGEELCAWVIAREGVTLDRRSVAEFCRNKIAHFKIPRHVFQVQEFPLTVTGKVQKFLIRDRSIEMIDAAAAAAAGGGVHGEELASNK